ncbi:hypothetical protein [Asanoa sp. NPDC050611]|uniref:hypothetical protein n=1 Tax=Asanoa sp. NPDC050611 TaxID=3157098 RepID=UPI003410B597
MPRPSPHVEPLVLDRSAADYDLATVRRALAARDWATAAGVVARQPGDTRTRMISWAGEDADRAFLAGVHAADPADSTAAAMLAERMITDAWEVRTAQRAVHVSAEQFTRFHAMLRETEELLVEATARQPADPALWTLRLITARGLQLGEAEARRRYAALAAVDPCPVTGQLLLLQQLCPKWGGSLEAMHAFAAESTMAAPEGAHTAQLVAEAHFEHLVELPERERMDFLHSRQVREALQWGAHRSVLHPRFARTLGWVGVANSFAMLLTLADDVRTADQLFTMLGPWVSPHPWDMIDDDPLAGFRSVRERAAVARRYRWS